ncbi:ParA family protein [Limimonas halophila]|uniref:AAA family ATPase n=1 Tax=Limimonas halophila TaxID=1082479 RepID=UPI0015A29676
MANLKGGTGKTTVAVNVAGALARRHDVVLVDADPQQAATAWTRGADNRVRARRHVMESGGEGGDGASDAGCRRWIEAVRGAAHSADYVVVDLPPRLSAVVAAAFALAEVVIVPVTPGGAEMRATRRTTAMIARARAARDGSRPDCILVPNRVDRRTAVGRALDSHLRELGEAVGPVLRQRAVHMSSFDAGAWVGAHAPDSEAMGEIEALVKYLRNRPDQQPAPPEASGAPASELSSSL